MHHRARALTTWLIVVFAIGVQWVAAGGANAECPTNNSAYNNSRAGSIVTGQGQVRWQVQNMTDAPCSKNNLYDGSSTVRYCMEITWDWSLGGLFGHYDSRNFINCDQSEWRQRVLSEVAADEANDPPYAQGASAIQGMNWITICGRHPADPVNPGEEDELGSRYNCDPIFDNVADPPSPLEPTQYGEYWIWYQNGTFGHFD
jgi:hypothetical protein